MNAEPDSPLEIRDPELDDEQLDDVVGGTPDGRQLVITIKDGPLSSTGAQITG